MTIETVESKNENDIVTDVTPEDIGGNVQQNNENKEKEDSKTPIDVAVACILIGVSLITTILVSRKRRNK